MAPALRLLVGGSLLLTAALVVLSAYIRLNHAGLGCEGWPACYGSIGSAHTQPAPPVASSADAYQRLVGESHTPQPWTAPAHRLIASLLGVFIIVLNIAALRRRDASLPRLVPLLLLALTVFLAGIGLVSGSLHQPAITVGNLFGGFAMLALLWWLWLRGDSAANDTRPGPATAETNPGLRGWVITALVLLIAQIGLGGLTSAHFAALACTSFPDCQGAWLPDAQALGTALDIFRDLPISEYGVVISGAQQQAIHITHRLGAWITFACLLMVAWRAARAGIRLGAMVLGLLVVIEVGIGIMAILTSLPVGLATAHNAVAALLLLCLLGIWRRALPRL